MLSAVVAAAVSVGGHALIVKHLGGRPGTGLAGPGKLREFGAGLGMGFALMTFMFAVLWILGVYRVHDIGWNPGIVSGLAIGIAAGFNEEVFFRGNLLRILDDWIGSWGALAVTALFFGVAHIFNPGASLFTSLALVLEAGILLGATYLLTRRLWLVIGLHIAWNTTMASLFGGVVSGATNEGGLLTSSLEGPQWLTGGAMGVEGSVVAIAVAGLLGLVILVLAVRKGRMLPPTWYHGAARE
ncbi:CPBP family intramembrane metalloprotease [Schaalia sp. 19OD2882]|nr:CPBP family intramembrane metalloprotease [Schaalia sp. 19OD2882]